MTEQEIKLELEKWRGLSAYEVAVKNGFNGTEKEWLEALVGGSIQITVCGKNIGTDGDIKVYAGDILMDEGALNSVKTKMEAIEKAVNETAEQLPDGENLLPIASGGTGARTAEEARTALEITPANIGAAVIATATASLPVSGWSNNQQSVSVGGVTANNIVIVTAAPASYEHYNECTVRCSSQEDGKLTFTCTYTPTAELTANVLILE